ncbi:MAG: radical SAM protein [Syntrophaceae bacterium]|nr:radical SAM protein [Syntrophaceae bacterium]
MEKLKNREHDFGSKLRQESTINRLREYVLWQRNAKQDTAAQDIPLFSPISINLDLTSACNFSCPYCVDSGLLNDGKSLKLGEVKRMIDVLRSHGLLSVILIGGGEPTLHKDFTEIVRDIKGRGLQLGIATNGTRMDKIAEVAGLFEEKDWIRISIDAAKEETFKDLHRPKSRIRLGRILEGARKVKEMNPRVSLGYSFLIIWEGLEVNGMKLKPNLDEISETVKLAREHAFDYVSLKPCLIRLEDTHRESLLEKVDRAKEKEISEQIRIRLEKAKGVANGQIKVLESVNLRAMLSGETEKIKTQPQRCHMSFFRTVVAPSGIFHCPAFRGVKEARIGENDGYTTESKLKESLLNTARSILDFDASVECRVVGCFYNETNWWLERLIHSGEDVNRIEEVEDENFFL